MTTTDKMFNQSLLVEALNTSTMTTAWALNGMSLVAKGQSFLAVSHVWADGTGAGAWKAGQVNNCLWEFWVKIAGDLGCNGVWWDTVCIPRDPKVRPIALNKMHENYADAKCTIVHDLYLAGIEWKNDGSPCIALVLSPWFSRGWTALELLLSKRVFVLFRQGDDGYILKDLDQDILAKHRFLHSHAHWIATEAVKRLRHASHTFESACDLLSVLQARNTSWKRDVKIIAGLMCGLSAHATLSEEEVTQKILLKLGSINTSCLLHGLETMSEPQFSWCPHHFVDIPSGGRSRSAFLRINSNGTLYGSPWVIWHIPSKIDGVVWPSRADESVQTQVQRALQEPEGCVILTCDSFGSQGLLVRLKAHKLSRKKGPFYCEYIGGVDVTLSEIRPKGPNIKKDVCIGYEPGMVDVGDVDWAPPNNILEHLGIL